MVFSTLLSPPLPLLLFLSFPNKQKVSEPSAAMTSALGSNLSELDRLLLELNAVQQSSPSFPTTGDHSCSHLASAGSSWLQKIKLDQTREDQSR